VRHSRTFTDFRFGGRAGAEAAARAHHLEWTASRGLVKARWRRLPADPAGALEVDVGRGIRFVCDEGELGLVEERLWAPFRDPAGPAKAGIGVRTQVAPFAFLTFAQLVRAEWASVRHIDLDGLNCRRANLRKGPPLPAQGGAGAVAEELDALSWPSPEASDEAPEPHP